MPHRRTIVRVLSAAVLLVAVFLPTGAHATPKLERAVALAGCTYSIDDPHWSTGGQTVVAKLNVNCTAGWSIDYDLKLYVCSYTPFVQSDEWHCTLKSLKQQRTGGPLTGSTIRYIPETGKKVRGCGNWFVNGRITAYPPGSGFDIFYARSPHYVYDCHAP